MAQDLKYLLINNSIEIPDDLVHFKEGKAIIIPVDFYDGEFEDLMNRSVNIKTAKELIEFIIDKAASEDSVVETFEFLNSAGVSSFLISSYRDCINSFPWLIVKNGKLLDIENYNVDPHHLLNVDYPSYRDIINDEEKYYSYDDAFYTYFKEDPERELIRRFG